MKNLSSFKKTQMKKVGIVSDPGILGGKPIIAGTRISVELILDRIASGMTEKEILKDYSHLNAEQIHAAVSFAGQEIGKKINLKNYKKLTSPTTLYTHEVSR